MAIFLGTNAFLSNHCTFGLACVQIPAQQPYVLVVRFTVLQTGHLAPQLCRAPPSTADGHTCSQPLPFISSVCHASQCAVILCRAYSTLPALPSVHIPGLSEVLYSHDITTASGWLVLFSATEFYPCFSHNRLRVSIFIMGASKINHELVLGSPMSPNPAECCASAGQSAHTSIISMSLLSNINKTLLAAHRSSVVIK